MHGVRLIFLVLIIFFFGNDLFATHLIGGEMQYECLGGERFRITLKVYRDCSRSGSTPLDEAAVMTIFEIGTSVPIYNFKPSLKSSRIVPLNLNGACVTVTDTQVCVEEGVYEIEVDLPASTNGYVVANQRCCRNVTVDNLVDPGNSGATFMIEIRPEALSSCNNSPRFDNFPPIVICAGEAIDFPFNATDEDGDVLVYEFCTPLVGGGNDAVNPTSSTGVAPDPSSPPPYGEVVFDAPTYEVGSPLTGTVPMAIDSNTGLIRGVPDQLGQFVVGVCVHEYRNGVLLSTNRRDFQFNVYNCTPYLEAELELGVLATDGFQEILSCGKTTLEIRNASDLTFVDEVEWNFDINGNETVSNTTDLEIEFPNTGIYEGFMSLNPSADCNDTLPIRIVVTEALAADFEIDSDLCANGAIDFRFNGSGPTGQWTWDFGDGQISTERDPSHDYPSPGAYVVELLIEDDNGCKDAIVKTINWFPLPDELGIDLNGSGACAPFSVRIEESSGLLNSDYNYQWDFGNGSSSSQASNLVEYEEAGLYSISLSVESPEGCQKTSVFEDIVQVATSPQADFSYTPDEINPQEPLVSFVNESTDAIEWLWDFGDGSSSSLENPDHLFRDTGIYQIQLVVFHESGCTDTIVQNLDIAPNVIFHMPNAFTPNGDGQNDVFKGKGLLKHMSRYRMTIWSRYGGLIFETDNPEIGWNGKHRNTGRRSPTGVYVYKIEYQDSRGKRFEKEGFATLVR